MGLFDSKIENSTILDYFEDVAQKHPDKIAVKYEDQSITFKDLNERCNTIGQTLQEAGVKKNQTVGIMMERSINMIVAIYGILKAGAAYLPLDPLHPRERIEFILNDSSTAIVLSDQERDKMETKSVKTLLINDYQDGKEVAPVRNAGANDLAYVIYTSGTTGKPKGVMIEHKGVLSLAKWLYSYGKYTPETIVLQNFNFIFDGSVPEFFSCGLLGNTLEILSEAATKDPQQLLNSWARKQITLVPSMFRAVLEYAKATNQLERFNSFDRIYVAGEALDKELLDTYRSMPGSKLSNFHNNYGPTEATVCATSMSFEDWNGDVVTIGKPIDNVRIDIFEDESACEVGKVGELCISGVGVARGYLNRPDLTKKSFVNNPLTGERMYRTGDLACWLDNGQIQYLGRVDDQVKLRGYRIEIEEIENQLRKQAEILDAQVKLIDEASGPYLCGYILGSEDFDEEKTLTILKEVLPNYMIPQHILRLSEFPRSSSGKIDKKAFPKPVKQVKRSYKSAKNEVDKIVVQALEAVLGVQKPSMDENFLDLGGDSISAIKVVSFLTSKGLHVSTADVLTSESIISLSRKCKDNDNDEPKDISLSGIGAREFELNDMQNQMLFSYLNSENKSDYSVQSELRVSSTITTSQLRNAVNILVEKFMILKGIVDYKSNTNPKLVLSQENEINLEVIQIEESSKIEEIKKSEFSKGFVLDRGPLIRFKLVKTLDEKKLIITFHHILLDGWSFVLIKDYLDRLCSGGSIKDNHNLSAYSNYLSYQKNHDWSLEKDYWEEYLKGYSETKEVTDYSYQNEESDENFTICEKLSDKEAENIRNFCSKLGVSVSSFYTYTFGKVLQYYTNSSDLVFGSIVSGRNVPIAGIDKLIGLTINTIPLRITKHGSLTICDELIAFNKDSLNHTKYDSYPFSNICNLLPNGANSVKYSISVQNMRLGSSIQKKGLELINTTELPAHSLSMRITIDKFVELTLLYDKEIFSRAFCRRIMQDFISFSKNILKVSQSKTSAFISDTVDMNANFSMNNTIEDKSCIIDEFEKAVKENPKKIAVKFEDISINYEELNNRCNALGKTLQDFGVKKNQTVAIMMDRSIDMIVAIYGILKAGAAYLPLDPSHPKERISFILDDSNTKVILTNLKSDRAKFESIKTIDLTDYQTVSSVSPERDTKPNDLAYVIYTSGTTGTPKGVMIEHEGVVNLANWLYNYGKYTSETVVLQNFNYIFDGSVPEIFSCGLFGNTLEILSEEAIKDPQQLLERWSGKQITMVPSMFRAVMEYAKSTNQLEKLNSFDRIYVAGEALDRELLKTYCSIPGSKLDRFHNNYGPTEATVCATSSGFENWNGKTVSIGKPIKDVRIDIFQEETECGIGVAGELCISGIGVARGYLNRPDLTEKSFVKNPLTGERMYRTGDLACWLEDGQIQYLGRSDDQVKLRGYRIEIEEIENHLRKRNEIQDAQVKVIEEISGSYLCGYVLGSDQFDEEQILSSLSEVLPHYMVPSRIVRLLEFPRSSSGKIDKKALPKPEKKSNEEYSLAKTRTEKRITKVFEEILGVKNPSIEDSFFELGGDSIKAIRVVSKIREAGFDISVREIMQERTISNISLKVKPMKNLGIYEQIDEGTVPLGQMQKAFFNAKLTRPDRFAMALLLKADHQMNRSIVDESMNELVKYHDQLRAKFTGTSGFVRSKDKSENCFELVENSMPTNLSEEKWVSQKCKELYDTLNLQNNELIKLSLLHTKKYSYIFFLFHHLVVDGVSLRILMDDFRTIYDYKIRGKEAKLPKKTVAFNQWVETVDQYKTNISDKEKEYWQKIDESIEKDFYPENNQEKVPAKCKFKLSKEYTEKLQKKVNGAYHTEINDVLLSALGMSLEKVFKKRQFSMLLESHGRQHEKTLLENDRTVGWFTTTYPIILKVEKNIRKQIRETKEYLRRVPNSGMNYSATGSKKPLFTFNYLGELKESSHQSLKISEDIDTGSAISEENDFGTVISINSKISEGCLLVEVDQIVNHHYPIKKIGNEFINSLIEVIDHCIGAGKKEKTVSDYGNHSLSDDEFLRIEREIVSTESTIDSIYPVTPTQKGILIAIEKDKNPAAYKVQNLIQLDFSVDLNKLVKSINTIVQKSGTLNTRIFYKNINTPVTVCLKNHEVPVQLINITEKNKQQMIKQTKKDDLNLNFDLEHNSPIRIKIFKNDSGNDLLLITVHHIVIDGWSFEIFLNQIGLEYSGENTQSNDIPRFEIYAKELATFDTLLEERYWSEELKDFRGVQDFYLNNTSGKSVEKLEFQSKLEKRTFSKQIQQDVKQFVKYHSITVSTFFETVLGILLQKWTNSDDVLFAKVISGREQVPQFDKTLGMFINTIISRVNNEDETFLELIENTQRKSILAQENGHLNLASILSSANLKLNTNILYISDNHMNNGKKGSFLNIVDVNESTEFDLTITLSFEEGLGLEIIYNGFQYSKNDVSKFLASFESLLREVLRNPSRKVHDQQYLSLDEENLILHKFNTPTNEENKYSSLNEILKKQAKEDGKKRAIVCGEDSVSYEFLYDRVQRYSIYLQSQNLKTGDKVALLLERNIDMAVALLSCLNLGITYIPIDRSFPKDRISYIVSNSEAKKVILNKEIDYIDGSKQLLVNNQIIYSYTEINIIPDSESIAYIIYTSGTTGLPKGVQVSYRNLYSYIEAFEKEVEITRNSIVLQQASISFDAFVEEFFPALANGGTVVIAEKSILLNISELSTYVTKNSVNLISCSPLLLNEMNKASTRFETIKTFISGGDLLKNSYYNNLIKDAKVFNSYGPTEATVCATYTELDSQNVSVPIGKPLNNSQVYILNGNSLAGIGMHGEICITGKGVSKGYINNPSETTQRFVVNPFGEGMMYRTGDLGYFDANGQIYFQGRIDRQLSIRGFRVEPGEIEESIKTNFDIDQVHVCQKELYEQSLLIAYYISDREFDYKDIQNRIGKELPDYMIPKYYIRIDNFPKTINGKMDETSLPFDESVLSINEESLEDITPEVIEIFEEALGIKIQSNIDFFDVGGHSLKIANIIHQLDSKYNKKLEYADFFQNRTINEIARKIKNGKKTSKIGLMKAQELL
ncbi:non-ribosomal peptide synthetase [Candidatus Enterococcus murrayae]|uniref:Amino acid adenylation domain-containing protein n=1 Tax=Candidatus Enterococcus murrayae TaxID=2815321 RepID=A0ABS3HN73_9ENTE|nr:non-ribosomal peptide synthetase [Enterococcus sp. MJM16]MBO0454909.1 amino acid adenylation domain-containing protein [Enterococcus sp. MJM16]